MTLSRYTGVIALSFFLCFATVYGSTVAESTVRETVTLAELLASQGTGATEIPSYGVFDDANNVTITHDLVGGYNANLIVTTGTIRGDATGGNWFSDSVISITPNGGSPFIQSVLISAGGEVANSGEVDEFVGVTSSIFSDPVPGGGAVFNAGPTVFQFHEDSTWDELPFAPDNTVTDLTIEFVEATAENEMFDLGSIGAGSYSAIHSHAPGGLDFFNFTLSSAGTIDIETFEAPIDSDTGLTPGPWGFRMTDTEIGLFDSNGVMIAQSEDIGFPEDDPNGPYNAYSAISEMMLDAGDYTLVTTTWNSSMNVEDDSVCTGCRIGDNIADVTAGADFGDFGVFMSFTSDGTPTLDCDFDGDGDCDVDDIDSLYSNIGTADAAHDLNNDGNVDALDITVWLSDASDPANPFKTASGGTTDDVYIIGDANFDGDVNSTDLGLLLNNFGSDAGVGWGGGDFDANANVTSTDLGLLLNNFGSTSAANAVPEPKSVYLIAMFALMAIVRMRRRF